MTITILLLVIFGGDLSVVTITTLLLVNFGDENNLIVSYLWLIGYSDDLL